MKPSRLATRLRTYDWAAAAIELVIVIVGILVALQVNNWNQQRLDRDRAEGYYKRIHADLLTDLRNMDTTMAFWTRVSSYGWSAIAYGETGVLAKGSEWETVLAYYQASQTFPFVQSDSAFTEMRSAGDLGLIADSHLRTRLADYYSQSGVGAQSIIHQQNPAYRQQVRGLTPWTIQQYIWSHCFRETSYFTQEFVDCPPPDNTEITSTLAAYQQSPTLLNNLRAWMSDLRVSGIVIGNTRKDASSLSAELDKSN